MYMYRHDHKTCTRGLPCLHVSTPVLDSNNEHQIMQMKKGQYGIWTRDKREIPEYCNFIDMINCDIIIQLCVAVFVLHSNTGVNLT